MAATSARFRTSSTMVSSHSPIAVCWKRTRASSPSQPSRIDWSCASTKPEHDPDLAAARDEEAAEEAEEAGAERDLVRRDRPVAEKAARDPERDLLVDVARDQAQVAAQQVVEDRVLGGDPARLVDDAQAAVVVVGAHAHDVGAQDDRLAELGLEADAGASPARRRSEAAGPRRSARATSAARSRRRWRSPRASTCCARELAQRPVDDAQAANLKHRTRGLFPGGAQKDDRRGRRRLAHVSRTMAAAGAALKAKGDSSSKAGQMTKAVI